MRTVSIIIPVYNAEKFLHHCLNSIKKQSYTDFELILVDDGSSDNSGKLCDEFAAYSYEFDVTVIHQKNQGVSGARNTGIKAADSKYIVFADSDDYVEEDYIGSLIQARISYPDAGHIWCGFQLVSGYNKENPVTYFLNPGTEISVYDRKDFMTLYSKWMTQGPYCKLYDTAVLKNMRFDTNLSLGEDTIFNLSYMDTIKDTGIVYINRPLYNYIQCGENTLYSKYREDLSDIYGKVDSELKKKIIAWKLPEAAWKHFYTEVYYQTLNTLNNTFRKENHSSFYRKVKKNNEIMKNTLFQESLDSIDVYINPYFKKILKSGSYLYVLIFNMLARIKNHN